MDPQKVYMDYVHPSSLLRELSDLWHNDQLCDAVITVDKEIIAKAHKLMMYAASPKLKADSQNASQSAILDVCLPSGVSQKSVHAFLRYIYEGFLILTKEIAKDLIVISNFLQINCLLTCCSDFLKECDSAKNQVILADVVSQKYIRDYPHVRTAPVELKEVVTVVKEVCKRPHADNNEHLPKRRKLVPSAKTISEQVKLDSNTDDNCVLLDDDSSPIETNDRVESTTNSDTHFDPAVDDDYDDDTPVQGENGADEYIGEDEQTLSAGERSFDTPNIFIKSEGENIKTEAGENEFYADNEEYEEQEQGSSMWYSPESQSVQHGASSQFVDPENASQVQDSQLPSDPKSRQGWNTHNARRQAGNTHAAAQGSTPTEMNAGSGASVFTCQFCGKQYTRYDTMQRHTLVHRTWRHKCDICGQGFYRKDYLLQHRRFSKSCGDPYWQQPR